jgi:hypothetical protein
LACRKREENAGHGVLSLHSLAKKDGNDKDKNQTPKAGMVVERHYKYQWLGRGNWYYLLIGKLCGWLWLTGEGILKAHD